MVRPCRLRAPSHTRISTIKQQNQQPHSQQPSLRVPAYRQFSQTLSFALPRKDSQHKDSINTEATEYSKSATDDESARQEDAAFNPDITDPQEQKDKAGEGTGGGTVSNSSPRAPRGHLWACRRLLNTSAWTTCIRVRVLRYHLRRIRTTLLTSVPRTQKSASSEEKQRAEQRTRAAALIPRATGRGPVVAPVRAREAGSLESEATRTSGFRSGQCGHVGNESRMRCGIPDYDFVSDGPQNCVSAFNTIPLLRPRYEYVKTLESGFWLLPSLFLAMACT